MRRILLLLLSSLLLISWGRSSKINRWLREIYQKKKIAIDREGKWYRLPTSYGWSVLPILCSKDKGKTWSKAVEIKPTVTYSAWGGDIFSDKEGNIYVVWCGMSKKEAGGFKAIFFISSKDNGKSWSKPIIVNSKETAGHYPHGFADSKGTIYVCWKKGEMLYLSLSKDRGKTWEGPWDIRRGDYPRFSEWEGCVFLTYVGKDARVIFITYTKDSGKTWKTITPGEYPLFIEYPLTVYKEGKLYVVFRASSPMSVIFGGGGGGELQYFVTENWGKKWKGPLKLK